MKYITFFIKFFYRIRYWLILCPLLIGLLMFWKTKQMPQNYTVDCSIYTGIITGVNILSESGITTTTYSQGSMMDNLLSIVTADQTLKQVSLRLYARIMVHGDLAKDNIYINADHFRMLYDHGAPIRHLIDKSSTNDSINEQRTYENLVAFENNDPNNYVYGIYQYQLPYVNRASLQKIIVNRRGNSDMLEISYTGNDPGVTYQTLLILIDEFLRQYQELRFGETNNVIAYFEKELARLSDSLRKAEDELTQYRVKNLVINYDEETKHVASLNRDYELQFWISKNENAVTDSLIRELENRLGLNSAMLRNNSDYLFYNNKITQLTDQLTVASYYPEQNVTAKTRDSLQNELNQATQNLEQLLQQYGSLKYSKEGVSNESVVTEWLNQVLAYKKSQAELQVLENRKLQMARKYVHFAPIGSILKRLERNVSITEQQYLSILSALNSARLRQKSLQMTSATLKVMNEPNYPLNSLATHRKLIVLGAIAITLLFVIFFFLIVELLDHTLRHKFRAELLTGNRVLGAFTRPMRLRYRKYDKLYTATSAQTVCNYARTYFKPDQSNIINLISNESGEGKSFIMQQMTEQFESQGMEVQQLSWHNEFQQDAKSFIQSLNLQDLDSPEKSLLKDKVILVEYPSLQDAALTTDILRGVSLNLQVIDSRRTWKNIDQQLFERTREMSGDTPLFIILNNTTLDAAEDLNGLMPPYTFFRKLFYRISQLGLTATDKPKTYV